MASCGYGTDCYGAMVGIGTTGGFSAVLASNPWLVARVLAYLRIATVAARIAAAVHACIVWFVCAKGIDWAAERLIECGARGFRSARE